MKRILIVEDNNNEDLKVSYTRRDGFMYTEYRLDFREVEFPSDKKIFELLRHYNNEMLKTGFLKGVDYIKSLLQ